MAPNKAAVTTALIVQAKFEAVACGDSSTAELDASAKKTSATNNARSGHAAGVSVGAAVVPGLVCDMGQPQAVRRRGMAMKAARTSAAKPKPPNQTQVDGLAVLKVAVCRNEVAKAASVS